MWLTSCAKTANKSYIVKATIHRRQVMKAYVTSPEEAHDRGAQQTRRQQHDTKSNRKDPHRAFWAHQCPRANGKNPRHAHKQDGGLDDVAQLMPPPLRKIAFSVARHPQA